MAPVSSEQAPEVRMVRRPQGARRARLNRLELARGAAARGWEVAEEPTVEFPAHLRMDQVRARRCLRLVTGDGFRLSTWRGSAARVLGMPAQQVQLQVLQVPAPDQGWEIYFGRMPERKTPILLPELFRDRVALLPEAQVMAGGDIERVLDELAPYLGRIVAPVWSLVATPGEVALLSARQPDTAQVADLVTLAGEIRDVLPAR